MFRTYLEQLDSHSSFVIKLTHELATLKQLKWEGLCPSLVSHHAGEERAALSCGHGENMLTSTLFLANNLWEADQRKEH